MSDSGFSRLPPGSRTLDPSTVPARSEQTVKIDSVRGELRDVSRTTQVDGKVTQVTPDGLATIRTDQGDEIDIQLRGRIILQEGQKVEIELPPGHPPRQAAIRPIPDSPQQTPQTPTATAPEFPLPGPQRPLITQTIIPAEIHTAILAAIPDKTISSPITEKSPTPAAIATTPLQTNSIIRLVPLPALPPPDELIPLPVSTFAQSPDQAFQPDVSLSIQIASAVANPLIENPEIFPLSILDSPESIRPAMTIPLSTSTTEPLAKGIISNPSITPVEHSPSPPPLFSFSSTIPADNKTISIDNHLPQGLTPPPGITQESLIPPVIAEGPVMMPSSLKQTETHFDMRVISIQSEENVKIIPHDGATIDKENRQHPLSSSFPASVTANVVATTSKGFPVLAISIAEQAPPDFFLLPFPASNLPVGSQLQMMISTDSPAINTPPAAPHKPLVPAQNSAATPAFDLFTGWDWPAFDDAVQILAQNTSVREPLVQGMANTLPNPGNPAQMPHALLFFIAAVRSGDAAGWMGEKALEILRRDGSQRGKDVLSRINRDMAGLSKSLSEPVSQDWRGVAIPLYWQNEIQKMNFFYRHQKGGQDDNQSGPDKNNSTRFIFDLHLDRIGDVQLDGLMKGKRLDLILRTRTGFSHTMQVTIRQRYLDVLESGNLAGDLAFQTRADQWVKVDIRPPGLETTV